MFQRNLSSFKEVSVKTVLLHMSDSQHVTEMSATDECRSGQIRL